MPYAWAAAMHVISHGTMGARPGTMRARVSLARSLVPSTKPASRLSESRASAASAAMLNSASGVSIIAQMRVRRSACMSSSRVPTPSSWSGACTLGTRIASGAVCARAARSSANHCVPMPLMRTNTSRAPNPPAFRASRTCARAASLASGATASSRSRMMPSAGRLRALSMARAFDPGMYSTLRRGRMVIWKPIRNDPWERVRSSPRAHADHVAVERQLGDLPPQISFAAIGRDALVELLEQRIGLRDLGVGVLRRLVGRVEDFRRESAQLRARRQQPLHRRRVLRVVLGGLVQAGFADDRHKERLIGLRQLVPLVQVDEHVALGAALPPTGIVVVLGDLDEAELLVVVRADPLGRVDRALLQRRIDVAGGELLRDDAELGDDPAGKPADAEFQPLHVVDGLDLLAEPPAHLGTGVADREADAIVLAEQLAEQLHAAAVLLPGFLLARIEPERQRGGEGEGRVLADIVVAGGVAHLDGAVLHRVEHLQPGHDLAGRKALDLELVVGDFGDAFSDVLDGAEQRIERFRPARRQAPPQFRRRLGDGRGGDRGGRKPDPGGFQEFTTFHGGSLFLALVHAAEWDFPARGAIIGSGRHEHA